MERYNSVTAVYRNPVPDFDDCLMLIAASLGNFYLDTAKNRDLGIISLFSEIYDITNHRDRWWCKFSFLNQLDDIA